MGKECFCNSYIFWFESVLTITSAYSCFTADILARHCRKTTLTTMTALYLGNPVSGSWLVHAWHTGTLDGTDLMKCVSPAMTRQNVCPEKGLLI